MTIKEKLKEYEGALTGLVIYCLGLGLGVLIGWAMWGME